MGLEPQHFTLVLILFLLPLMPQLCLNVSGAERVHIVLVFSVCSLIRSPEWVDFITLRTTWTTAFDTSVGHIIKTDKQTCGCLGC